MKRKRPRQKSRGAEARQLKVKPLKHNQSHPLKSEAVICGLFSKKEAARHIASGTRHLHCSALGANDPCAKLTQAALQTRTFHPYPWELMTKPSELSIVSSSERYNHIQDVIRIAGLSGKRDLREKLEGILEELVTNAIYHAYRKKDGTTKYARRDSITLADLEKIKVRFYATPEGIFLSVTDRGGSFGFDEVSKSFGRCYGSSLHQIEAKEGGAGLGIYMSFEAATHLKVVSVPGKETTVSCWLADKSSFDSDLFSFNFYEWR